MQRLLAAAAVLLLAGCNQPASDPPSAGEAGPAPSLAAVEPEARDWAQDAYLVGVLGVEAAAGASRQAPLDAPFLDPMFADADAFVGDGQASHWLLEFAADSKETHLQMLVSSLGTIEARREHDAGPSGAALQSTHTITNAIALYLTEAVPTWNQGTGKGPLTWTLANTAGAPAWTLEGAIDGEGRSRPYVFDAVTGGAITSLTATDARPLARNQGSEAGTLTVAASVKEFSILFEGGHSQVKFTIAGTGPTEEGFGVTATLPNDETLDMVPGETVIDLPIAGAWKLIAAIDALAVSKEYTISWCAPGGTPAEAC